jgi:hypothetical protein
VVKVGMSKSIALALILAAGWLLAGCNTVAFFTQTPVPPEKLAKYELDIEPRGEPTYDADGYEVTLGFDLLAHGEFAYNSVVQEIVQETVYKRTDGSEIRERLTLVEAFRLNRVGVNKDDLVRYRLQPFQRDRHYERGYQSLGSGIARAEVFRVVRFYAAFVRDADWTSLGFAHLPGNRDGSVTTSIPRNFNERHQRGYIIDGQVEADDRAKSKFYSMRFSWWRDAASGVAQAQFTFRNGQRPPDEPVWVTNTIEAKARSAGAGE